jgi:GNAT superfamily N-acetyltransferase
VISFEGMEENLRATLAMFTRAKPNGETRAYPGLAVAFSGVHFSMFNSAVLTSEVGSAAELDRRIKIAATHFAARHAPWSFWVCENWLDRATQSRMQDVFFKNGLHTVVSLPGMEAVRVGAPSRLLPEMEFRRVKDDATRSGFNHIMSMAFGMPHSIAREVYEAENTWRGEFRGYLGYADGLAVASSATVVTAGVVGVYAVGTLPGHQHKGYAEAVMRYALTDARRRTGVEHTTLQSSEAGFRLYERMGYRTIARYAVFAYS